MSTGDVWPRLSETPVESNSGGISTPAVAYIDTIELFFRYLAKGMRSEIEAVHGRPIWATQCQDRLRNAVGYRLGLHQPTLAVVPVLNHLQVRHAGKLFRFDTAFDFTTHTSAWVAQNGLLRWRRSGRLHEEENALYWIEQSSRPRRSNRDLIVYDDKPSKITGAACTHLELRFYGTASVRRQGVERVTDLVAINPRQLFQHHIKLVNFDPEVFKQSKARAAVKRDVAFYRGKETSAFVDGYRASIPQRVRSLLQRLTQDRVQQVNDVDQNYVSRLKPIPIDTLNLPDRLSWSL